MIYSAKILSSIKYWSLALYLSYLSCDINLLGVSITISHVTYAANVRINKFPDRILIYGIIYLN